MKNNKPITWNFGARFGGCTDFSDKGGGVAQYVAYMLNRVQSMIKYDGLPETLSKRNLSLMLQVNGWVCIPDPDKYFGGKMYAFTGGLGGEPDPYYMPTICTVSNPALDFSENLVIDRDCVIVPHDSLYIGLLPMFSRYASLLAENDISMRLADINARIISLISAGDDKTLSGARQYIKEIEDGKMGVAAETSFLDGIRAQPYATGAQNSLTQLIEFQQYLKAGWFNDLGLNANYNMKREAINSDEAQMNNDALLPLVDDIITTQQTAFDKVNAMFGTEIKVSLSSAWEDRQETPPEAKTEESEARENETD